MRDTVRILRTAWHGLAVAAVILAWALQPAALIEAVNAVPRVEPAAFATAIGRMPNAFAVLAAWAVGALLLRLPFGSAAARPARRIAAEPIRYRSRGGRGIAGELHDRLP
jgi:hypothetical protein